MALMQTLGDNFSDGVIDPALWTVTDTLGSNGVSETGGQLRFTIAANSTDYSYIESVGLYDLTNSSLAVELPGASAVLTIPSLEIQVWAGVSGGNGDGLYWFVGNSWLQAYRRNGAVRTAIDAGLAYNATDHRWLRIRYDGATVYWDYSADGISWTNQVSTGASLPGGLNSCHAMLNVGCWDTPHGATVVAWDNVNTILGTVGGTLGSVTGALTGQVPTIGTVSGTLGPATGALVGVPMTTSHVPSPGWYGYLRIVIEAGVLAAGECNAPPVACPNDGEPLQSKGSILWCPFDGFRWPE